MYADAARLAEMHRPRTLGNYVLSEDKREIKHIPGYASSNWKQYRETLLKRYRHVDRTVIESSINGLEAQLAAFCQTCDETGMEATSQERLAFLYGFTGNLETAVEKKTVGDGQAASWILRACGRRVAREITEEHKVLAELTADTINEFGGVVKLKDLVIDKFAASDVMSSIFDNRVNINLVGIVPSEQPPAPRLQFSQPAQPRQTLPLTRPEYHYHSYPQAQKHVQIIQPNQQAQVHHPASVPALADVTNKNHQDYIPQDVYMSGMSSSVAYPSPTMETLAQQLGQLQINMSATSKSQDRLKEEILQAVRREMRDIQRPRGDGN